MTDLDLLDGELYSPESPGYDLVRRPVDPRYGDVRPQYVVRCASVADVVRAISSARSSNLRLVPRGGGHCFAGRSSTDGVVLDLSNLNGLSVDPDGIATIGAGARLAEVYSGLHSAGRALPAGCGATVGITGLTLGGGIGLIGRKYGLTCDRLVRAQVVLADGRIVECDEDHEAELFWALRGAGGGQFGVVTSLRFATIAEPTACRIEAYPRDDVEQLVAAWQTWAPDAPDELTVDLALIAEPGEPLRTRLFGASLLNETATRALLRELVDQVDLVPAMPYHRLKSSFSDPPEERVMRSRSEFFSRPLSDAASLLAEVGTPSKSRRELSFTAMGGAYNRVAEDATAFAHRNERFLLDHVGSTDDPWIDASWAIAHRDGSGRVYPNFPDAALDDGPTAYHAGNLARLRVVKRTYDPDRFFDFPQAI
ncbi:FAD/FMN-containing dehydrogenase [Kribbella amoyensis]|uniref:FAD/FMN-containing dehydrogenase n=1 Tax=Kribbella amoyensis TaxID=996641 RepID=A0A561BJR7_9ACTN|nr:FAD-binding oxidoreductase [Kribbella amoyensis]TWD79111.1 FAD/FMN-containing dehydrogenase [Kribbella amoyensis]